MDDIFKSQDFLNLEEKYQNWVKEMTNSKCVLKTVRLTAINFYLKVQENKHECMEPYKGSIGKDKK